MARGEAIQQARYGSANDFTQVQKEFDRVKEKVEKLTGERGDATGSLAAVRRADLRTLATVEMQSKQVAAAPTAADFNALQTDVAAIFAAIKKISNVLGTG